MSEIAIRAEHLSKAYQIVHHQRARQYRTLQEDLLMLPRRIMGSFRSAMRPASEQFWALDDISFDVHVGEVLGIIGRNGAGKSTLLKILSRITEPTRGRAAIFGRVGSLLEVGTGFHAELTGRENIFLNGAILGMRRSEIARRFDEIVEFAEVQQFIDTPVKRYSSGMYMRLAFAVAAHLDPEILVIDEVLAVGDADFQKKCLGKMGEVSRSGRTVLFVSHQMNAVRALCDRCLWLDRGVIAEQGDTEAIVAQYLRRSAQNDSWSADDGVSRVANPYFTPQKICLVDQDLKVISRSISADEPFGVLIDGLVETLNPALTVGFAVYTDDYNLLFWSLSTDTRQNVWPKLQKGRNTLVGWLPKHFFNEGDYRIELIVSLHYQAWISQPGMNAPSIQFSIRGGLSESPYWMMARPGMLAPILPFTSVEN
jgi:lipopolysaccharide transport system ATP-binding protein